MSLPHGRSATLSGVMKDAILQLCRANVSYAGHVEVDGIICISGQEEGQQIVVKVHEHLYQDKDGCPCFTLPPGKEDHPQQGDTEEPVSKRRKESVPTKYTPTVQQSSKGPAHFLDHQHDAEQQELERRDPERQDSDRRDTERWDSERRDSERRNSERRDSERRDSERRDSYRSESLLSEPHRSESRQSESHHSDSRRSQESHRSSHESLPDTPQIPLVGPDLMRPELPRPPPLDIHPALHPDLGDPLLRNPLLREAYFRDSQIQFFQHQQRELQQHHQQQHHQQQQQQESERRSEQSRERSPMDIVPYVKQERPASDRNGDQSDKDEEDDRLKSPLDIHRGAIDLSTRSPHERPELEHLGLMAGFAESRLRSLLSKTQPARPHPIMPFLPRRPMFQNALLLPAPSPECKTCGVLIAEPEALQEHNETHHGVFTCRVCYRTFTSRSNLERHSRLHTGHKPYICSKCGKAFSRKDHLTNHSAKHAYKCGKCLKRFVEKDALRGHYCKDHGMELTNICQSCNKGFADPRVYTEHLKSHPENSAAGKHPMKDEYEYKAHYQFKCTECGLVYGDAMDLARHKHLVHMLYSCLGCYESFSDPLHFSQHFVNHQNELNIFECYACRQVCSTYDELREHERGHHFTAMRDFSLPPHPALAPPVPEIIGDTDTYLCPYCAKVFPSESLLMEHVSIHEGLQQHHICGTCGERFENLENLEKHEQDEKHGTFSFSSTASDEQESRRDSSSPQPVQAKNETNEDINVDGDDDEDGPEQQENGLKEKSPSPLEKNLEDNSKASTSSEKSESMGVEDEKEESFVITENPGRVIEVDDGSDMSMDRDDGLDSFSSNERSPEDWFGLKHNHHTNFMVPVPAEGFLCSICALRFMGFKEYESHCFASHYRYPCMYCPKTFAQRPNRDRHVCIHTGEKPFACPECGQRFSRGDKLKLHRMKAHNLEYPGPYVRLKDPTSVSSSSSCSQSALSFANQCQSLMVQSGNSLLPSSGQSGISLQPGSKLLGGLSDNDQ